MITGVKSKGFVSRAYIREYYHIALFYSVIIYCPFSIALYICRKIVAGTRDVEPAMLCSRQRISKVVALVYHVSMTCIFPVYYGSWY